MLQPPKKGCRGLKRVTRDYRELQGATGGYKGYKE